MDSAGGRRVAVRVAPSCTDDWAKDDLEDRAHEIGIEGRLDASKDEPIKALRNH